MNVKFDIKYDAIHHRLIVSQNEKPVSTYSQFARCNGQPFATWYEKLPQYCFLEANNQYSVFFEGSIIFAEILQKVFRKDSNCRRFQVKSQIISDAHRMRWADELLTASGVSLPPIHLSISVQDNGFRLVRSPILTQMNTSWADWRFSDLKKLDISLHFQNTLLPNATAVIIAGQAGLTALPKGNYNEVAAILLKGNGFEFIRGEGGILLFSCGQNNLAEFLRLWIQAFIMPTVLVQLQQILSSCQRWCGMDMDFANAKRELLTAERPYMKLKIPSRIELNDTGFFSFVKLPEDMHCRARSNNPDVALLEKGNVIRPQREGIASFTVTVQNYPEFSVTQGTTIYRYFEVNRIQLTVSRSTVREGERLDVKSTFYPLGAQNIAQARWEISPNNILKKTPQGNFLAQNAGYCTITVTVGSVTASIAITVLAKPTGIGFDCSEVTVKLGDVSKYVNVNIFPMGSWGGIVQYRVSDTSILNIDERNGQLIPIAEGDVVVTADLLDNGSIIDSCSCHVTVLPPKDIVTPDSALVFLILSLLAVVFFYSTTVRVVPCLIAIACAVWVSVQKKKAVVTALCAILSLLICVLMIWGGV